MARPRPMVAMNPLSKYENDARALPASVRRMLPATARPICMATGLIPGSGALSPAGTNDAMSPMTNASG